MPEIEITVSGSAGMSPDSALVTFDHAALVSAGRSRADGYDFGMYHATLGPVRMIGVVGVNTASCYVEFIALSSTPSDDGYRLRFGDLGWHASRVDAVVVAMAGTVDAVDVPAIALPAPSRPLETIRVYDVDELRGPAHMARRRRLRNQTPRRIAAVEWRRCSPEDFYAIRAWTDAHAGGAGSIAVPSWLVSRGFDAVACRAVPGSLELSQESRRQYSARLVIEELAA